MGGRWRVCSGGRAGGGRAGGDDGALGEKLKRDLNEDVGWRGSGVKMYRNI